MALVLVAAAAARCSSTGTSPSATRASGLTATHGLLTRRVVHLDRDRIRGTDVRDVLRRPFRLTSATTAIAAGVGGR